MQLDTIPGRVGRGVATPLPTEVDEGVTADEDGLLDNGIEVRAADEEIGMPCTVDNVVLTIGERDELDIGFSVTSTQ